MKSTHLRLLRFQSLALLLIGLSTLTACGGGSSLAGPSPGLVVLKGSVLGGGAASTASAYGFGATGSTSPRLASGVITVSVQETPAIATTVASDGSFTLRGLPTGAFTLVFTLDGATVGTLTFNSVLPNQELTITVSLSTSNLTLVEEKRDGIGHGDLEVEGRVEQVLLLSTTGDSRFLIAGHTVVVRPGQTTIRRGNAQKTAADLTLGMSVHVKGSWLPAEGSVQPVLAAEVKIQDQGNGDDDGEDDEDDDNDGNDEGAACVINGASVGRGIELEGRISSGNATSFLLSVNGNRSSALVDVAAGGASIECTPKSGPNAPTPAQCSASVTGGAQVHVSGTLNSCNATSAQVSASRVQVQK